MQDVRDEAAFAVKRLIVRRMNRATNQAMHSCESLQRPRHTTVSIAKHSLQADHTTPSANIVPCTWDSSRILRWTPSSRNALCGHCTAPAAPQVLPASQVPFSLETGSPYPQHVAPVTSSDTSPQCLWRSRRRPEERPEPSLPTTRCHSTVGSGLCVLPDFADVRTVPLSHEFNPGCNFSCGSLVQDFVLIFIVSFFNVSCLFFRREAHRNVA